MQVLVNSDSHIKGGESLSERVEGIVTDAVGRFADRITRVEVHLNDVNADKGGARDKRCMMEARLGGFAPIAVTDQAATLLDAIEGAAGKLQRALESALGRMENITGRVPRDDEIASTELLDEIQRGERPASR